MLNALDSWLLLKPGPESTQRLSIKVSQSLDVRKCTFTFIPLTSAGSDTIMILSNTDFPDLFVLYFLWHFTHNQPMSHLISTPWQQAKLKIFLQKAGVSHPNISTYSCICVLWKTIQKGIQAKHNEYSSDLFLVSRFSDKKKERKEKICWWKT